MVAPGLTAIEIAAVVVAVIAIIAAARIAEAFLIPVVAGILFSYTLRPLVSFLERVRLPRLAATTLVMLSLVALVSASFYAVRGEFNDAVASLPTAARKLRQLAVNAARSSPGPVTNMKAAAANWIARRRGYGQDRARRSACASATSQLQDWITEQSGQVMVMLVQISMALLLTFFVLASGILSAARWRNSRVSRFGVGASPSRC